MELTTEYNDKTSLFGTKTAFMFGGYILQILCGVTFSILFPTDVLRQIYLQALLFAALFGVSIATCVPTPRTRLPDSPWARPATPQAC